MKGAFAKRIFHGRDDQGADAFKSNFTAVCCNFRTLERQGFRGLC